MNASRREGFYMWRCLSDGQVIKVGALALEQLPNGRINDIQFKYDATYLEHPSAIPLDPYHAPLKRDRLDYETAGRQLAVIYSWLTFIASYRRRLYRHLGRSGYKN